MALLGRIRTFGQTHPELRFLIPLLFAAGLAWFFAELTDDMLEQDTRAFDRGLLLALREPGEPSNPIGPRWAHELGRDVTALGGFAVLTMLTLAATGYLWIRRRPRTSILLLIGVVGASIVSHLLKEIVSRPRPDLVPHMSEVYTASFPSGHSAMSAAAYLTIGMLLGRAHKERAVRGYFMAVAALLVAMIGVSRVYLGVHWPTDVLAGWALGTAWALGVWAIARWIETRAGRRAALRDRAPAH